MSRHRANARDEPMASMQWISARGPVIGLAALPHPNGCRFRPGMLTGRIQTMPLITKRRSAEARTSLWGQDHNGAPFDRTVPCPVEALRDSLGVSLRSGSGAPATLDLGGAIGTVKVAMAHGLKPTRQIVEAVLAGTADFDFIEIMACPGGCVDGGGTLRSKKAYLPHALKRRETLFGIDRARPRRQSHANPQVQALYRDFLERPYSEKAHYLLHTWYQDRRRVMTRTVQDIWNDITMSTKVY